MTHSLQDVARAVSAFMDARDWARYHAPKNLAAALAVEAAELQEIFLWREPGDVAADRRQDVEDEAADVAICLFNFCNRLGIDLGAAVEHKLGTAGQKYPVEAARGRAEKYETYGAAPAPRPVRESGVLLHPTMLPTPWGIGDLGPSARAFVRWLSRAGQKLWQVLPLGPVDEFGSPYASASAFAGNPLLLSVDDLLEDQLLHPDDAEVLALRSAAAAGDPARVDWAVQHHRKLPTIQLAARRAIGRRLKDPALDAEWSAFEVRESYWLDGWARFSASKRQRGSKAFWSWPVPTGADAEPGLIAEEQALQFLWDRQWTRLRREALAQGVRIVGDLPIFVAGDSADVASDPGIFGLDEQFQPTEVSGVPPDYFSETGQRWGNPLYRWDRLKEDGYRFWIERFRTLFRRVDLVRIDHFRGFAAAWAIPATETDARRGRWVAGPGRALFDAVREALVKWDPERFGGPLPFIAEDLGIITPDVEALRRDLGLPGMKVLQFAFSEGYDHPYLPSWYEPDCVVYTGTHDNDTAWGWYRAAPEGERDRVRRFLARDAHDLSWDLIRLASSSAASRCIVPIQDLLDLGSEARLNVPGKQEGNWAFRLRPAQLEARHADRLAETTRVYGRAGGHS